MTQYSLQEIKLVILDRDGVINHDSPDYIKSPDEWRPITGSLEAIAKLNHAGIKVAIASNQSGVGRKMFSKATLEAIHDRLQETLKEKGGYVDAIYICPHLPDSGCDCRKPKPGMLQQACREFSTLPEEACFVGDSYRDIEAADAIGCMPILVLTGNGKNVLERHDVGFIKQYDDLASFVEELLKTC